ncbi:hypothetical protein [Ruegeria sp. EL01]|jgi:hypothetical protein|uniref:hypothetical protein n=1 Tax=Ruegeria sp. EL01 TaxID=2107578 RepID=UPI000EA81E30|nr:hypothetical protein [Ruegeria sp. EL01]
MVVPHAVLFAIMLTKTANEAIENQLCGLEATINGTALFLPNTFHPSGTMIAAAVVNVVVALWGFSWRFSERVTPK